MYNPKIKDKIEGFNLLKSAFTEYPLLLTFTIESVVYEWDRQALRVFDTCRVIKISELRTALGRLPDVKLLQIYGAEVDVEFSVETGLFGGINEPQKVAEVNQTTPVAPFTEKVSSGLISDLFSDDDGDSDDFDSEPIDPPEIVEQSTISDPVTGNSDDDDDEDLALSIPIFMGQKDSENRIVKIPTILKYEDIEPFLNALLSATGQKSDFIRELETGKYNAVTLYCYPAVSYEVNQDGNLRKVVHRSQKIAEIKNRKGSIIERNGRESAPIYASLLEPSIIKVQEKEKTFLCQTYLKKVDSRWVQGMSKIAYFDPESRHLAYFNKDSNEHNLHPIVSDPEIFPDLSVWKIGLEHLSPMDKDSNHWETSKSLRYLDSVNQKVDVSSANKVQEKFLVSPVWFKGFDHPNLPASPPKPATITERVEPKPVKIDGSRTNNHELQLRTILGNVPCILTVQKSNQQWQLIALPIRTNPLDLTIYLSDKLPSRDLLEHIAKQITELVQLKNTNTNVNLIISQLDQLTSNIKSGIKPDKTDVLGATQSIRSVLNENYIKHESSYSDNYYRYHVLGNIKIVETVETEKPTYSMTVLGDERVTRRSSIPLVINWLRRIPQILSKHFKEDYPTNDEIKAHLMSVYPFYKKRLKEGEKVDKSFTNSESEMIVRTDKRLVVEIYLNGDIQTRQLISITKPIGDKERQGKIPVKVSSSLGFSLDNLQSFLKCTNERKDFDLLQKTQSDLNAICQKFINNNVRLFSRERENKTTQTVSTKDLLGFTGNSKGLPQVLKEFKKFTIPYTSNSEVNIGKLVNLLTLEVYDQHDNQILFDAMIKNWKVWAKSEAELELAGVVLSCKNPGDLLASIHYKTRGHHSQIVWGAFIDELHILSNLKIGFRTSDGVLLTPWSLLDTSAQTWNYRVKIQLIDIFQSYQPNVGIESLLQLSIDTLEHKLDTVIPSWRESISQNLTNHLEALEYALNHC